MIKFTAQQIADYLHGKVDGDPNKEINTFCKIEEGQEGGLTFLANPKYEHYLYETKASAALVNDSFKPQKELTITLIRVPDAYAALATLMQLANSFMTEKETGVDKLAFVDPSAKVPEDCYVGAFAYIGKNVELGKGCRIYPQAYVGDNVKLGDNCILYPHVTVYKECKLGNNCIIHAGTVIGADGFGFAPEADGYHKIPQLGNVEIADNVEIGANTCIDRAAMGSTKIGKGTKLDNLIQVAHNCTVGENTVMAAQVGMAGSSHVGDWCMFGGQAGLSGHIRIGNKVSLAGQTGVMSDIEDGSQLLGSPGMPVREAFRSIAMMRRLPEMSKRIDKLEKLIEKLTSND